MSQPRAVLVMLDGLRPDAIAACNAPTLQSLAAHGAFTLSAQSVVPSITLPCHMSIFHSVPPERHNVLSNIFVPMARPIPGLFETIHAAKKKSVMFYSWGVLRDVARPLSLHKSVCNAYDNNPHISDHITLEAALPTLRHKDFDFCFLYFRSIDEVGHLAGWMSNAYLQQVEIVCAKRPRRTLAFSWQRPPRRHDHSIFYVWARRATRNTIATTRWPSKRRPNHRQTFATRGVSVVGRHSDWV